MGKDKRQMDNKKLDSLNENLNKIDDLIYIMKLDKPVF